MDIMSLLMAKKAGGNTPSGGGSVNSVNGVKPDGAGDVALEYNDLINRPFGEKSTTGYIVEKTTLTADPEMGAFVLSYAVPLVLGETYTVMYNGVSYECAAVLSEGGLGVGNIGALGGEDTGEPFFFTVFDAEGMSILIPLDGSTEAVFSLSGLVTTITPIPYKFMPDPVLCDLSELGLATLYGQMNTSKSVQGDFYDLYNAMRSGDSVKFKIKFRNDNDSDEVTLFAVCGSSVQRGDLGYVSASSVHEYNGYLYFIFFNVYSHMVDVVLRKIEG